MQSDTVYGLLTHQRVTDTKRDRARALRQHMTASERMLWAQLRKRQLRGHRFRRQQIIDGFIVDFYCHHAGLVIELDGAAHSTSQNYDAERDSILAGRGLRILRLANDAVQHDLDAVLRCIAAALE